MNVPTFIIFLRLGTKCDLAESNQPRIRIQRPQKRIEMFISSGGQYLSFFRVPVILFPFYNPVKMKTNLMGGEGGGI